jgi:hypothetical protein
MCHDYYIRETGFTTWHYRGPCSNCSGVKLCRIMQGGQVAIDPLWGCYGCYFKLYGSTCCYMGCCGTFLAPPHVEVVEVVANL